MNNKPCGSSPLVFFFSHLTEFKDDVLLHDSLSELRTEQSEHKNRVVQSTGCFRQSIRWWWVGGSVGGASLTGSGS